MKIFFLALLSATFFCQVVFGQNNSQKRFAAHLLPAGIEPNRLKKLDLEKLEPTGKPSLAGSDVRYYQKDDHQFRIDYVAADRLKKINDQGGGRTFAVFVGNEAISGKAFSLRASTASSSTRSIPSESRPIIRTRIFPF